MDRSLIFLGVVIAVSLASAATWHLVVKSYLWAVAGSSLTVALVTLLGYPLYRGVAPNELILADSIVLGALIALGVGVPFKRRRDGKAARAGDGA